MSESNEIIPTARPWYKKKRFIIPFALMVLIIGFGGSSSSDSEEANSASVEAPESSVPAEVVPTEDPNMTDYGLYPQSQADFVSLIEKAREDFDSAETDLQESVIVRGRDKALCGLLSGGVANKWVGKIKDVGANGEGKAYLEIEIANDVRVQTWNNALSDIFDNTLIPTSSKFFDRLVAMQKGDLVYWSAKFLSESNSCLKGANLTEYFYGKDPKFIVDFKDVVKQQLILNFFNYSLQVFAARIFDHDLSFFG